MNQFTVFLSIVCLTLAQGASTGRDPLRPSSTTGQRIVGGVEIDILDVPFQVSLQQQNGHSCGGSIIGESWVLTAAHCVKSWSIPDQVRVGSSHSESGGRLIKIAHVILHPSYDELIADYDFALVELEESVQLSEEFYAVELPEQDESVEDGQLLQASGWGVTQHPEQSRNVLRAVNVPAINQEVCRKLYERVNVFTDRMMCAGFEAGGKDACYGDSGGPLVAGRTLVGVVSWGLGCAEPLYPGVYARVATVRDWIKKISGI